MGIIHVTGILFLVLTPLGRDSASVVAFLCAATLSIGIYLGVPAFLVLRIWHARDKLRVGTKRVLLG